MSSAAPIFSCSPSTCHPIFYADMDAQLQDKLPAKFQGEFKEYDFEVKEFISELTKYRGSGRHSCVQKIKKSLDLLESLYICVLDRAIIAYFCRLTRLGCIQSAQLKYAHHQYEYFLSQDFINLGKQLLLSNTPEIVSHQILEIMNDTQNLGEPTTSIFM